MKIEKITPKDQHDKLRFNTPLSEHQRDDVNVLMGVVAGVEVTFTVLAVEAPESGLYVMPEQRVIALGVNNALTVDAGNGTEPYSKGYLHDTSLSTTKELRSLMPGKTPVGAIKYRDGRVSMEATVPDQKFLYEIDLGDSLSEEAKEDISARIRKSVMIMSNSGRLELTGQDLTNCAGAAIKVYYAEQEGFTGRQVKNRLAPEMIDVQVINLAHEKRVINDYVLEAIEDGVGYIPGERNLEEIQFPLGNGMS